MLKEEWKVIDGYSRYIISNTGEVKNLKTGKILKKDSSRDYYEVVLSKNGKTKKYSIHRLVAQHFIPNPENRPQVNHKDGNKLNNCVNNLEWVTRSENILHSYKNGLQIHNQLGKYGWNSFRGEPVKQINIITGKIINVYGSMGDAARQNNIRYAQNIKACADGITKSCAGYKWEYVNKEVCEYAKN